MSRRIVIGLKITLPILVLAIAGATAASLAGMRAQPEQRASAPLPPLVRVHTVASQEHRMVVESQGTVRPRTESRVVNMLARTTFRTVTTRLLNGEDRLWTRLSAPNVVAGDNIHLCENDVPLGAHLRKFVLPRLKAHNATGP